MTNKFKQLCHFITSSLGLRPGYSHLSVKVIVLILVFNLITLSYLPAATVQPSTQPQQEETVNKFGLTAFAVVLLIVGVTGIVLGGMSSWVDYIQPNKTQNKQKKKKDIKK